MRPEALGHFRPGRHRLAIASGVVPTEDVNNVWLFELKVAAGTVLMIASAWLVYRRNSAS
jgi:hypothetical protein